MFSEKAQMFFKLNPIYYLVEGYRDCFVQDIWFWQKYHQMEYFWALILLLMMVGTFVFDRLRTSFADFI